MEDLARQVSDISKAKGAALFDINMSIDGPLRKQESDMKAELSLATPSLATQQNVQKSQEENILKKRKWEFSSRIRSQLDHNLFIADKLEMRSPKHDVDLHKRSPLPLDWEQCLDLNSGEMYYINTRTGERTFHGPRQRLDLELKISSETFDDIQHETRNSSSMNNEMLAIACTQCHMFVIMSKYSPSCPNCKYVHPFN